VCGYLFFAFGIFFRGNELTLPFLFPVGTHLIRGKNFLVLMDSCLGWVVDIAVGWVHDLLLDSSVGFGSCCSILASEWLFGSESQHKRLLIRLGSCIALSCALCLSACSFFAVGYRIWQCVIYM